MRQFPFTKSRSIATAPRRQRGDFLIESLIGVVLMAIIGMGVVHVTSKVAISQKDMRMQEIAINQMRTALIRNGMGSVDLCTTGLIITLPNDESVEAELMGCTDTATATINGVEVTGIRKPIFLSATSEHFGQIVVGGTWSTVN